MLVVAFSKLIVTAAGRVTVACTPHAHHACPMLWAAAGVGYVGWLVWAQCHAVATLPGRIHLLQSEVKLTCARSPPGQHADTRAS